MPRIQGAELFEIKPPQLPTLLIAVRPAAAGGPAKNFDGRLHITGWAEKLPAAVSHMKTNFRVVLGV
jgi:hypothetical protein